MKKKFKQEDYNKFLEARSIGERGGTLDLLQRRVMFDELRKKFGEKGIKQIATNLDNMKEDDKVIKNFMNSTFVLRNKGVIY